MDYFPEKKEKCVPETICLRLLNTYDIILFDRKARTISPKKKRAQTNI